MQETKPRLCKLIGLKTEFDPLYQRNSKVLYNQDSDARNKIGSFSDGFVIRIEKILTGISIGGTKALI